MNPPSHPAGAQVRGLFDGTPYRLIRPLGQGGMGAVFLVEHVELGRQCVAKVMHSRLAGSPIHLERMRVEAQSLGRLRHPNIVQITGFGVTHDERPFLVMEWLQGRVLAEELERRGQLGVPEALNFASQMLSGLSAAHALGIVHRDIKPENLFLSDEADGARRLKLLDFGVVRVMPDAPEGAPLPLALPTNTGMVVGTPLYVSPEGALGQRVDARADVYAAALVLYNMLTGRGPFDHLRGEALLAAHAMQAPEPPSRYMQTRAPESLDAAVLKALSKHPDQRFQSALELKAELDRLAAAAFRSTAAFEVTAEVLVPAQPEPSAGEPTPLAGSPAKARVWALAALTALLVALLVALATTAVLGALR